MSHETGLRQEFLTFSLQSTASLDHLVQISRLMLTRGSSTVLPHSSVYRPLRDRVNCLEIMVDTLRLSYRDVGSVPSDSLPAQLPPYGTIHSVPQDPPYRLRASPWTQLATDRTVSHLVCLFLALVNPYWRFVEDELFVIAMLSGVPRSHFCSPLLVHAVMSCASVSEPAGAIVFAADVLAAVHRD